MHALGHLALGAAVVLDGEDDDESADQEREERREKDEKDVERIDVRREGRSLVGEERHQLVPRAAALRSRARRDMSHMDATRTSTVAAPQSRTMFMIAAPYFPLFGS